ncbi:unnamed protein product [Lactuca virosa]|uniref:Uncharacterized protein n=1 Tax=Lactuca virosa TaxID=75947 RepID=A0AAU9LMC7_9ASTR|nr:unnamed protein product [Lactuca virosa]
MFRRRKYRSTFEGQRRSGSTHLFGRRSGFLETCLWCIADWCFPLKYWKRRCAWLKLKYGKISITCRRGSFREASCSTIIGVLRPLPLFLKFTKGYQPVNPSPFL